MHQLAHQIFHVTTDVTGLAELRCVGFYKRDFNQIGDVFDQICFPDAGRSDQNHILFDVFNLLCAPGIFFLKPAQIIRVVVMIANRDRENLLRLFLLNDEPVEVRLDVSRQEIEFEFLLVGLLGLFLLFRCRRLRLGKRRHRDSIAEVLFHELSDLGLELFR